MMAGTMFFDSIKPTHLHAKQITFIKKDMLQDFIQIFESRYALDDKIDALRKDVFADVMDEIKTMSLYTERTEKKDTKKEMLEDRSLSTFDHMKANTNKYEEKSKKKKSSKRNNNAPSALSNFQHDKIDPSLKHQKEHNTKQHDVDISLESLSQILQQLNFTESNERKLQESRLMCNGTLFEVEIKLDRWPEETSWELIDVKTNDIVANASYEEEDSLKLMHEEICVEPGPYIFTLYDSWTLSWNIGISCGLNSCYNISINNEMVLQGSTFQDQISHRFDSSPSSLCIGSLFLLESNLDFNDRNIKMEFQDDISDQVFNLSDAPMLNDDFTYSYYACVPSSGFYLFSIETIEQDSTACDEFDGCYRISINDKIILKMDEVFEKNVHKIRISESFDGEEFICNGTIFILDILLDWAPRQISWELIDEKETTIVANVSYEEAEPRERMHEEICVEPGPYIFILYDTGIFSWNIGIDCGLSSCYNISIDNQMIIQGSTFQDQISHRFDSSPSSLCVIDSTFLLELRLERSNSEFHSHLFNEATDDTFNLIKAPIQNANYTNAFYACLEPGIYVMDVLNVFDFPASDCGSSDCFQVSVNDKIIANGNDLLSLVEFKFVLSNNFIGGQRYCHRSPFLSFIDSVDNFPWNNRSRHIMNDIGSLSSHDTLNNIHTPQYKAACWLLYDDVMKASVEDELTLERYALAVILYSTNRDAEMMLSEDCCDLFGIVCDDMGHIVKINWGEYALIVLMIYIL